MTDMANTLKINEIFYSIQGEGHFTGRAATFIRLAGCNLKCPFCDTDHRGFKLMTPDEIVSAISRNRSPHVVITGGEPALHNLIPLIDALHADGRYIQVETNGTLPLPSSIDWVTCSPKDTQVKLTHIDEIKQLYLPRFLDGNDTPDLTVNRLLPDRPEALGVSCYSLQPCDVGERYTNHRLLAAAIDYIGRNPRWRLSLQTHKLIDIK